MYKKIRILIIASILGLIALSVIQGYLIKNTYELKKKQFLFDAKHQISRIDDYSPIMDSINDIWQEYFIDLLSDYKRKRIRNNIHSNNEKNINSDVTTILDKLKKKTASLNEDYIRLYKIELAKKDLKFNIKFQKRVHAIIIKDSLSIDTIFFSDKKTPKFYLIGDSFPEKSSHRVSSSLWMTEHDFALKNDLITENLSFDLEFLTIDLMNIDGWKTILYKKMTGIFLIALLLFVFVFGLLFYSIKNLIKQKKIAEVKTDFVNNITHELKTPLATLTLATKMLSNDSIKNNTETLNTTVQTIERQNIRLQKLIDQVLDNSLGYKEIKLNKETVAINEYLNLILNDFMLSVNDTKVNIDRNFLDISDKSVISIDKFYFATAILNILENAVKYSVDEINIVIKTEIKDKLILSIKDNGIGIPKNEQKNLFEKFYRVANKDVHNIKGLGLGLYYTNQIVKAHLGTIKVISEEQIGTEFVIEIPI